MTQVEWNGMKNTIIQVTYFRNSPMTNLLIYLYKFTCFFIVIFLHIEKKWLLRRNLAVILPLNPNCLESFSVTMLLMKVSKYWKIVELPKISIKMKIFKTFYGVQTASCIKKIVQPRPPSQIFSGIRAKARIFLFKNWY